MWKLPGLFAVAWAQDATLTLENATKVLDGADIMIKNHGFKAGEVVWYENTGTAFGDITTKNFYTVQSVTGTDKFKLAELLDTIETSPISVATAITHTTEAVANSCGTGAFFIGTGAAQADDAGKQKVSTSPWTKPGGGNKLISTAHGFAIGAKIVVISPASGGTTNTNGVDPFGMGDIDKNGGNTVPTGLKVWCSKLSLQANAGCSAKGSAYTELVVATKDANWLTVALTGITPIALTAPTADNDASSKDVVIKSPSTGTKKHLCAEVKDDASCAAASTTKVLYYATDKKMRRRERC
jgi:hypothetical protein